MSINDKLRDGTCGLPELLESLRRFPQGSTVKINRGMIFVFVGGPNTPGEKRTMYTLDDTFPEGYFNTGEKRGKKTDK